ncbi:nicotinate-nucleotide--dimethylbenzimidazole phosphoribosyltransferase [Paenibacillus crassostreae]|uniref:Nicotinate-nucleotide--dimethylbenzimidazole phosphoribosyltransferase n=1 Tax=Paenibacillus crassostreae TaxID=1763538 RepID=A0A167GIE7_9BACL|nr:nicotinate-nucleotide--dimethylbenzimidazole phosphoribosyltransferase [Paenibacillus crassostreae]AOZ92140.1 nicotinate-nucleotide--dimethylbenzimidazole phosphoribosyltransferase [Paenibacillus crassostreae]OAB77601.1 nicotinate-nucleotide--dimethylbenzimidazole phosphoribosyltransferase [Paenibacillus crassostreae]
MSQVIMQQIGEIRGLDQEAIQRAKLHISNLTVPPGSLGKLETMAIQLAGITGKVKPFFDRREVIIMAGDHGVCEEGVSAFPQEVTPQMVHNFLAGGAAVNVLARGAGAEVVCVDIGVNSEISHPDLLSRKIRYGTANMAQGPAMTYEEAIQSILIGVKVVEDAVKRDVQLFITGEMGIGNTTASSAVSCALTNISVKDAVGRGTGIDDARLLHKISVVEQALKVNAPNPLDPIDVLAKVGGLEIGGLVGVILGSAVHGCPVIIDGFISSAAALLAKAIHPTSADYMIVSHASHEQGHRLLLQELGLRPVLELDLRVGEGTGGVLCLHLVDAACRIINEMATFESAGISGESEDQK